MPSFNSSNVTFGIEFEFMSPCPESKRLWRQTAPAAAARVHIAELMSKDTDLPVACKCTHEEEATCPNCHEIPKDMMEGDIRILSPRVGTIKPSAQLPTDYFFFQFEALTPYGQINSGRRWPGVEMSTPAFKHSELSSGLPSVKCAISALRNMDAQITADDSCGLHVHVGIESGMTCLVVKKVVSLIMLLEGALILPLCAPSRLESEAARPISQVSNLAGARKRFRLSKAPGPEEQEPMDLYVPPLEVMQPGAWHCETVPELRRILEEIWACESLQELAIGIQQGMHGRAGLAISLRDHDGKSRPYWYQENMEDSPSTVEFRYSQMSFDMLYIRNWVRLLCRVVEIAQLKPEEYKQCLVGVFEQLDPSKTWEEPVWQRLLKGPLQLDHQVWAWKHQIGLYKSGIEISHLDKQLLLISEEKEEENGSS